MSAEMSAAIIGGLISGGVVLMGVVLAEGLRRQRENRQRRFQLLLTGRTSMDEFAAAAQVSKGQATLNTQLTGNDLQAHVLELRALNQRADLRHLKGQRKRDRALHDFLLKLSAAKVRLLIEGVGLNDKDIETLKGAMVAYEDEFAAKPPEGADRAVVDRYIKDGLDGPQGEIGAV
jgi:hypothetical protein